MASSFLSQVSDSLGQLNTFIQSQRQRIEESATNNNSTNAASLYNSGESLEETEQNLPRKRHEIHSNNNNDERQANRSYSEYRSYRKRRYSSSSPVSSPSSPLVIIPQQYQQNQCKSWGLELDYITDNLIGMAAIRGDLPIPPPLQPSQTSIIPSTDPTATNSTAPTSCTPTTNSTNNDIHSTLSQDDSTVDSSVKAKESNSNSNNDDDKHGDIDNELASEESSWESGGPLHRRDNSIPEPCPQSPSHSLSHSLSLSTSSSLHTSPSKSTTAGKSTTSKSTNTHDKSTKSKSSSPLSLSIPSSSTTTHDSDNDNGISPSSSNLLSLNSSSMSNASVSFQSPETTTMASSALQSPDIISHSQQINSALSTTSITTATDSQATILPKSTKSSDSTSFHYSPEILHLNSSPEHKMKEGNTEDNKTEKDASIPYPTSFPPMIPTNSTDDASSHSTIFPNSTMSSPEGLLASSPLGARVLDEIVLQDLPPLPPSNSNGNLGNLTTTGMGTMTPTSTIHKRQLSSSSLRSTDSPIIEVIVPHSENDMTTPNRSNVTIGMNQLNRLDASGGGGGDQVDKADQYYHSTQQSLDYSNPSLDNDQPSDEFSLSIQPSDECSISITASTSDEYLNGGGGTSLGQQYRMNGNGYKNVKMPGMLQQPSLDDDESMDLSIDEEDGTNSVASFNSSIHITEAVMQSLKNGAMTEPIMKSLKEGDGDDNDNDGNILHELDENHDSGSMSVNSSILRLSKMTEAVGDNLEGVILRASSSDENQDSASMSVNSSIMRLTHMTEAVGYNLDSAIDADSSFNSSSVVGDATSPANDDGHDVDETTSGTASSVAESKEDTITTPSSYTSKPKTPSPMTNVNSTSSPLTQVTPSISTPNPPSFTPTSISTPTTAAANNMPPQPLQGNCPARLSTFLQRHHGSNYLIFNISGTTPSDRAKVVLNGQIVNLDWVCAGTTFSSRGTKSGADRVKGTNQGIPDTSDITSTTNVSTANDTANESQEVEFPDCPTASTIPTLPCLLNICYAMDAYLQLDGFQFNHHDHDYQQESEQSLPSHSQQQRNVAVVYCRTGYQKTGIVIAAYLKYTKRVSTTLEGFRLFWKQRGVTTQIEEWMPPSLWMLFSNFDSYMDCGGEMQRTALVLKAIALEGVPLEDAPRLDVWDQHGFVYSSHFKVGGEKSSDMEDSSSGMTMVKDKEEDSNDGEDGSNNPSPSDDRPVTTDPIEANNMEKQEKEQEQALVWSEEEGIYRVNRPVMGDFLVLCRFGGKFAQDHTCDPTKVILRYANTTAFLPGGINELSMNKVDVMRRYADHIFQEDFQLTLLFDGLEDIEDHGGRGAIIGRNLQCDNRSLNCRGSKDWNNLPYLKEGKEALYCGLEIISKCHSVKAPCEHPTLPSQDSITILNQMDRNMILLQQYYHGKIGATTLPFPAPNRLLLVTALQLSNNDIYQAIDSFLEETFMKSLWKDVTVPHFFSLPVVLKDEQKSKAVLSDVQELEDGVQKLRDKPQSLPALIEEDSSELHEDFAPQLVRKHHKLSSTENISSSTTTNGLSLAGEEEHDKSMLLESISDVHFDFESDEDSAGDINHGFGAATTNNFNHWMGRSSAVQDALFEPITGDIISQFCGNDENPSCISLFPEPSSYINDGSKDIIEIDDVPYMPIHLRHGQKRPREDNIRDENSPTKKMKQSLASGRGDMDRRMGIFGTLKQKASDYLLSIDENNTNNDADKEQDKLQSKLIHLHKNTIESDQRYQDILFRLYNGNLSNREKSSVDLISVDDFIMVNDSTAFDMALQTPHAGVHKEHLIRLLEDSSNHWGKYSRFNVSIDSVQRKEEIMNSPTNESSEVQEIPSTEDRPFDEISPTKVESSDAANKPINPFAGGGIAAAAAMAAKKKQEKKSEDNQKEDNNTVADKSINPFAGGGIAAAAAMAAKKKQEKKAESNDAVDKPMNPFAGGGIAAAAAMAAKKKQEKKANEDSNDAADKPMNPFAGGGIAAAAAMAAKKKREKKAETEQKSESNNVPDKTINPFAGGGIAAAAAMAAKKKQEKKANEEQNGESNDSSDDKPMNPFAGGGIAAAAAMAAKKKQQQKTENNAKHKSINPFAGGGIAAAAAMAARKKAETERNDDSNDSSGNKSINPFAEGGIAAGAAMAAMQKKQEKAETEQKDESNKFTDKPINPFAGGGIAAAAAMAAKKKQQENSEEKEASNVSNDKPINPFAGGGIAAAVAMAAKKKEQEKEERKEAQAYHSNEDENDKAINSFLGAGIVDSKQNPALHRSLIRHGMISEVEDPNFSEEEDVGSDNSSTNSHDTSPTTSIELEKRQVIKKQIVDKRFISIDVSDKTASAGNDLPLGSPVPVVVRGNTGESGQIVGKDSTYYTVQIPMSAMANGQLVITDKSISGAAADAAAKALLDREKGSFVPMSAASGVAEGVPAQKVSEGALVAKAVISKARSDENLSKQEVAPRDDPEYAKYFLMLKQGVPVKEVKTKLEKDGKDPAVIDGEKLEPATGKDKSNVDVPLREDQKYLKYFKMLKMGLGKEVVMHALKKDGEDPSIIDLDPNKSLASQIKKPDTGSKQDGGESGKSRGKDDEPPLKDDPDYVKYFKMLSVGLPMGAVKNALQRAGLDPSIMDLDPEKSLKSQLKKESKEEEDDGPALKDDPDYVKYFKMLSVGLPMGAVKNALQRVGLDPSIMDLNPDKSLKSQLKKESKEEDEEEDDGPALKDDPDYVKFFKMLSVGLPMGAVKNALQREEKDPSIMDLDPEKSLKSQLKKDKEEEEEEEDDGPALKDDPEYTKYFRMLRMGLPPGAVKNALQREGKDPSIIDLDPEKSLKSQLKKDDEVEDDGPPLKDDPAFSKYFKMLKLGLPIGAVQNALQRDGLDPSIMDLDPEKSLLSQTKKKKKSKAVKEKKPKVRRKKIYWNAVDNSKIKRDSLWGQIQGMVNMEKLKYDAAEFESLFTETLDVKKKTKKEKEPGDAPKKVKKSVQVIDGKRGMNGGIILARLKMNFEDMASYVDHMISGKFDYVQLKALKEFLPTEEEESGLKQYITSNSKSEEAKDDAMKELCACEKYMVAMMEVPDAGLKFDCLLFEDQFDGRMEHSIESISTLQKTCDDVKNSDRLRKLMAMILTVGNYINTGGSGTLAAGFSLDALLKLDEAKAFDRKTSVLHYLVRLVKQNDESLSKFKEDLSTVQNSEGIMLDAIKADLKLIDEEFQRVKEFSDKEGSRLRGEDGKIINPQIKKSLVELKTQKSSVRELNGVKQYNQMEHIIDYTHMELFCQEADATVKESLEKLDLTQTAFLSVLQYFGEDEKMSTSDFFGTLNKFIKSYDTALDLVEKQEAIKKKEQKRLAAEKKKEEKKLASKLAKEALLKSKKSGDSNTKQSNSPEEVKSTPDITLSSTENPMKSMAALAAAQALKKQHNSSNINDSISIDSKQQQDQSQSTQPPNPFAGGGIAAAVAMAAKKKQQEKAKQKGESNDSADKPINPFAGGGIAAAAAMAAKKKQDKTNGEQKEASNDAVDKPINPFAGGGIAAAAAMAAKKKQQDKAEVEQNKDSDDAVDKPMNPFAGGGIAAAAAMAAKKKKQENAEQKKGRNNAVEKAINPFAEGGIAAAVAMAARKKQEDKAKEEHTHEATDKPINPFAGGGIAAAAAMAAKKKQEKKAQTEQKEDSNDAVDKPMNPFAGGGIAAAAAMAAKKKQQQKAEQNEESNDSSSNKPINPFAGGGIAAAAAMAAKKKQKKKANEEQNEDSNDAVDKPINPFAGGGIAAAAAMAAKKKQEKKAESNNVTDKPINPFAGGGIAAAAAMAAKKKQEKKANEEQNGESNDSSGENSIDYDASESSIQPDTQLRTGERIQPQRKVKFQGVEKLNPLMKGKTHGVSTTQIHKQDEDPSTEDANDINPFAGGGVAAAAAMAAKKKQQEKEEQKSSVSLHTNEDEHDKPVNPFAGGGIAAAAAMAAKKKQQEKEERKEPQASSNGDDLDKPINPFAGGGIAAAVAMAARKKQEEREHYSHEGDINSFGGAGGVAAAAAAAALKKMNNAGSPSSTPVNPLVSNIAAAAAMAARKKLDRGFEQNISVPDKRFDVASAAAQAALLRNNTKISGNEERGDYGTLRQIENTTDATFRRIDRLSIASAAAQAALKRNIQITSTQ